MTVLHVFAVHKRLHAGNEKNNMETVTLQLQPFNCDALMVNQREGGQSNTCTCSLSPSSKNS